MDHFGSDKQRQYKLQTPFISAITLYHGVYYKTAYYRVVELTCKAAIILRNKLRKKNIIGDVDLQMNSHHHGYQVTSLTTWPTLSCFTLI